MPELPKRTLLQQAHRVRAFLEANAALDKSRSGRFWQYCKSVEHGDDDFIPADRADFPVILQASRDLEELNFILDVLGEARALSDFGDKIEHVFRDAPLPSEAGARSRGRDHQFELFVFAIMLRGGLRPAILPSSADFIAHAGRTTIAVEAKRLKSIERLDDRVRDAADQIRDSGHPGIICVDFSAAVGPQNSIVIRDRREDLSGPQHRRINAFLANERANLEAAIGDRPVIGMVFIDSLIAHYGVRNDGRTGNWIVDHLFDHVCWPITRPRDQRLARKFSQAFTFGLPRYHPSMYYQPRRLLRV